MSEAQFTTARDSLNDRAARKLEVLYHCSRESLIAWKVVCAYLSNHNDRLNYGNNVRRNMREYLQEFAFDRCGDFKEDSFIVNERGRELLKNEAKRIAKYLKPIQWEIKV